MATHGSIGEFQGHPEGWTEYIERLECYFTANDVATDEKRRAILLAYCGDATYSTIRSLVAPRKPTEVPYDDLVKLAQAHYNPRPSQIVQRFKFKSRTQQAGESIASYVAELRRLSEHCGFGQSLDDMLRDRLVCGLAQARIQQRLLAEVDLTLDKAMKIAQAMEVAKRDAKELRQVETHPVEPVHKVNGGTAKPPADRKPCFRCGGQHDHTQCRFRDVECHACGKRGHLKRVCRSRPTDGRTPGPKQPIHKAQQDVLDLPAEYTMYPVTGPNAKPWQTPISVEDHSLVMEVDTGAAVTVISEATFNQVGGVSSLPQLHPSMVKLRTYTGEENYSGRGTFCEGTVPGAGGTTTPGCCRR